MRIKPATPISIAYLASFVLLLLSTLTAPIINSFALASYQGTNFGVFGYCGPNGNSNCSAISLTYNTNVTASSNGDFDLPLDTRRDLSTILIVHPIAAFFNLVCFALSVACHFRAASHSSRYLMGLLILSFPTLLITLLAFLVDILIFIPNLRWGSWIVLVATVLVIFCSIFTCAMRRTLVSRKARKKRIAEDADMNGSNAEGVYQGPPQPQLAKDPVVTNDSSYTRAESPPPMDGAKMGDKLPQFATYQTDRSRPSTDDRTPLNNREPSIRSASSRDARSARSDPSRPPPISTARADSYNNDGRVSPVSPVEYDGAAYSQQQQQLQQQGRYYGAQPTRGRGAPPGYRGRGYGPPPGRGGAYRGYPGGRGGMPPQRGGPGYRGMPAARGRGPPPGWQQDDRQMMGAAAAAATAGAMMDGAAAYRGPPQYQSDYPQNTAYRPYDASYQQNAYGQQQQQPTYDNQAAYGQPAYAPQSSYGPQYSHQDAPVQRSVEPQAAYGQPAYNQQAYAPQYNAAYAQQPQQQPQQPSPVESPSADAPGTPYSFNEEARPYRGAAGLRRPTPTSSPANVDQPGNFAMASGQVSPRNPPYGSGAMPPMAQDSAPVGQAIEMDATLANPVHEIGAAYSGAEEPRGRDPAELGASEASPHKRKGSPHANLMLGALDIHAGSPANPVEIDSSPREAPSAAAAADPNRRPRASSDAYYEDVAPRFAQDDPMPMPTPPPAAAPLPHDYSLTSFYSSGSDPLARTRSPGAASDTSNFTSVSQRGINPAWQGGPPQHGYSPAPPPQPRADDRLLAANPDFAVPGAGPRGHARGSSAGGSHHYPAA